MRFTAIIVSAALTLASSAALADEWTSTQTMSRIQYNASSDDLYFVTSSSGWGSTSCPNATYVQIPSSLPGRDKLLALAMAAHLADKTVQFVGTCAAAGGNYFYATYIIVN